MPFLIGYTFAVSLGTIQTAWTIAGNTATAPVLICQFGWNTEQAIRYNTLINTSAMVGLTVGSLTAGYSVGYGRKKAILCWNCIVILGCGLSLLRTMATICIGRFLIGLAAGLMNVACSKAIDETIPIEQQAFFGATTNMMINFGIMVAMALGFILPTDPFKQIED